MDNILVSDGIPRTSNAGGVVEQGAVPCHVKSTVNGTKLALSSTAQPLKSTIESWLGQSEQLG